MRVNCRFRVQGLARKVWRVELGVRVVCLVFMWRFCAASVWSPASLVSHVCHVSCIASHLICLLVSSSHLCPPHLNSPSSMPPLLYALNPKPSAGEAADMSWKDLERDKVASRLLNQPIQKRFPGYGIFNGTIVSWDASSRKLTTLYEDGNSDGLSQSIPAPVLFVQRMSVPCQALVDPDVDGA